MCSRIENLPTFIRATLANFRFLATLIPAPPPLLPSERVSRPLIDFTGKDSKWRTRSFLRFVIKVAAILREKRLKERSTREGEVRSDGNSID